MYVWIADYCLAYEGPMRLGVFSSRDKAKAACAEHAEREFSWTDMGWTDNPTFSTTGTYEVEQEEVK